MNVCAFLMIFFWVPETKQRTLEELDYVFAVPLRKFIKYQTGSWLPWWIQRYVLRNNMATLKPLYKFDKGVNVSKNAQADAASSEEYVRKDDDLVKEL